MKLLTRSVAKNTSIVGVGLARWVVLGGVVRYDGIPRATVWAFEKVRFSSVTFQIAHPYGAISSAIVCVPSRVSALESLAQLPTEYGSILIIPEAIAHSAPQAIDADLDASFVHWHRAIPTQAILYAYNVKMIMKNHRNYT